DIVGSSSLSAGTEDSVIWTFSTNGRYSSKSYMEVATGLSCENHQQMQQIDLVWNCNIPPRFSLLAWFALMDGLATKDKLLRREIIRQGEGTC
ncbi:hypothetical protein PIB30_114419, partial [Stylosanthes scabra]|nr:hypothetical protein [Stylosanthes scabra]